MAIIKTKFDRGVEGATNIVDAGTEGTKVASGTTAQRGSTTGQWRFNSTTGNFEGRNANNFVALEATPTISSVDDGEVDSAAGGNQTIVVTGNNFSSGGTITFVGTSAEFNASTTTFNSVTQVTAVAPKSSFLNAQEPYKVKFTSSGGLSGTSASGLISVDNAPTWTTSAGNIGNVYETKTANITVAATDTDGDTISYSVSSGSLPTGLSINSSTGAITGTAPSVSGDTTSTFDLRATANSKTVDRTFNIIVKEALGTSTNPATSAAQLYNAGYTTDGAYYINNTFTGGSARNCYCRFNTRDGVHWHRWTPYHLATSTTEHSSSSSAKSNTDLVDISGHSLDIKELSASAGEKDFTYSTFSSGSGISHTWNVGLQMSALQGFYLGAETYEDSNGDSGNYGGGTAGNKGNVGIDWASSNLGTGDWGSNYSPDLTILQTGLDTTRNNNNARNFGAVKFEADGSNTNFTSYSTEVGGVIGVGGTSNYGQSDLWSRYSNQSNTGHQFSNSGNTAHSGAVASNYYWTLRIAGWSDTSNVLRYRGIFWLGDK